MQRLNVYVELLRQKVLQVSHELLQQSMELP